MTTPLSLKHLLLIALMLSVSLSALFLSIAQAAEEDEYVCAQNMDIAGKAIVDDYENFLNEYFKSEQPSSEQIENAMRYYRYTRYRLDIAFDESIVRAAHKTFTTENKELRRCQDIRDEYIQYTRNIFQGQALQSAASKRTFKVIDGFKALNANLEEFSPTFHETFPGLFNRLDSNLPCYAKQCL